MRGFHLMVLTLIPDATRALGIPWADDRGVSPCQMARAMSVGEMV